MALSRAYNRRLSRRIVACSFLSSRKRNLYVEGYRLAPGGENGGIWDRMVELWKDPITERHEPQKLLHSFHTDDDLHPWQVVADSKYGGKSTASISISGDGSAVFEGHISTDVGGELKKSGFCGIRHAGRDTATNLAYYDAFVLRVRPDAHRYFFNVDTTNAFVDGFYQSMFQVPGATPLCAHVREHVCAYACVCARACECRSVVFNPVGTVSGGGRQSNCSHTSIAHLPITMGDRFQRKEGQWQHGGKSRCRSQNSNGRVKVSC
jgi:hypothetical protein